MTGTLLLDRTETASAIEPTRLLDAVSDALVAVSRGTVSAPARVAARAPAGLLGAMPAYVPGQGLAAKLVSVFAHGGPSGGAAHRGVVALFDEDDGLPIALMSAEVITALRTAAVATVAMRTLANPSPACVAILGTGTQARAQLDFLLAAEVDAQITIGARNRTRAVELASRHRAVSASTIESAVEGAQVVLCCTAAREPILRRSWIRPGTHVSSVGGSDGPELDAEVVADGTLFVEWLGAVSEPPPAGAHELQGLDPSCAVLVGTVLDGRHPGRAHERELTVFKSTGHAALDVAAARVAYDTAQERGLGRAVSC